MSSESIFRLRWIESLGSYYTCIASTQEVWIITFTTLHIHTILRSPNLRHRIQNWECSKFLTWWRGKQGRKDKLTKRANNPKYFWSWRVCVFCLSEGADGDLRIGRITRIFLTDWQVTSRNIILHLNNLPREWSTTKYLHTCCREHF